MLNAASDRAECLLACESNGLCVGRSHQSKLANVHNLSDHECKIVI